MLWELNWLANDLIDKIWKENIWDINFLDPHEV